MPRSLPLPLTLAPAPPPHLPIPLPLPPPLTLPLPLTRWETELSERDPMQAQMAEGKREMGAYLQARRHLRPFFKQLKTRSMPYDVLSTMVEITRHMQQREYVRANDAYIKCSIGNMPWPMGITGTGVHERQGRQHLRESKIAHVMNDETQRKYLTSIKRLMTFSQHALPADPSKCVL